MLRPSVFVEWGALRALADRMSALHARSTLVNQFG